MTAVTKVAHAKAQQKYGKTALLKVRYLTNTKTAVQDKQTSSVALVIGVS